MKTHSIKKFAYMMKKKNSPICKSCDVYIQPVLMECANHRRERRVPLDILILYQFDKVFA